MKKKIGALALAAVITVSAASFTVSAEEENSNAQTFEITAEFTLPAIDVTFPTSIEAVLNPYHLSTANDGWATGCSGVASPEYEITNNSGEIGINVSARLSAVGSSGVQIVTVDGAGNAPEFRNDGTEQKQVFAFLNTTTFKGLYANSDYTPNDSAQLAFTETAPEKAVRLMQIDTLSSGYFKIQGDVVESPAAGWNSGDSVTFSIVFDVSPYNPVADE